jgi:hypothetical protein
MLILPPCSSYIKKTLWCSWSRNKWHCKLVIWLWQYLCLADLAFSQILVKIHHGICMLSFIVAHFILFTRYATDGRAFSLNGAF